MSHEYEKITVDGIDYLVESDGPIDSQIDVLWVYGVDEEIIASAEADTTTEEVYASYHDKVWGRIEDHDVSSRELFSKTAREVAEWLVAPQPGN